MSISCTTSCFLIDGLYNLTNEEIAVVDAMAKPQKKELIDEYEMQTLRVDELWEWVLALADAEARASR